MTNEANLSGPNPTGGPSWGWIWLCAILVATPLGWSSVAFVYFGMLAAGKPLTFEASVLAGLPEWYSWAALTPLVFSLGRRFRLERRQWIRAALFHLVCGTVVALADLALVTAINRHFGPTVSYVGPVFWDVYLKIVLRYFHYTFIIYWVIVAAAHAAQYYLSSRQRELEAVQLQAELGTAQLAALRMQLQPHFLFNTLHTIAGLVRDGRGLAATSTIARLGDLLRQTLGNGQCNEVPLREELRFIEAYLEIEQIRFSDQLEVGFAIEHETLEVPVPRMSLQPLVENAIRHGIARESGAGRLDVRARRQRGSLRIEIRNDGPSYGGDLKRMAEGGVGLANTRARLSRLYGAHGRLEVRADATGGTLAVLEVPWREPMGPGRMSLPPIRVLIADDEPAARRTIHLLLAADPDFQILEDCCDGLQVAEAILRLRPDLVFLDIQMPRLDGFEVLARLPSGSRPLIIFVTAYDSYSLRAFDVHAADYLLKPFSDDRFRAAVRHARDLLRHGPASVLESQGEPQSVERGNRPQPVPRADRIAIPTAQGSVLVRIDDIEWVEARGDYVRIYSNGRADLLRETISGVERELPPTRFVRIHRSSIVNIAKVKEIRRRPGGDQVAVLQSGVHCRLSRSGRERLGRLVGRM